MASPLAFLELGRSKTDEFGLTDGRGKLSDFSYSFKPGAGGGANVAVIGIALPTVSDEGKLFSYLAANSDRKFWFNFGWRGGTLSGESGWIKGYLAKIDYRYNLGQELIMTLHLHSVGSEIMGELRDDKGQSMATATGEVGGGKTWGDAVVGNLAQLAGNVRDGEVKVKATTAREKLDEAANKFKSHFGAALEFAEGVFSPDMGDTDAGITAGNTTFKDIVCMDHLVSEAGFAWYCPSNLMGAGETRGLGGWSSDEINSMWGTRHDAWDASQERADEDWASRFGFMNEYLENLAAPQSTGGSRGGPGVPDLPAGGGGGLPDLTKDLLGLSGGNGNAFAESEKPKLINHSGPGQGLYLTWTDIMAYINQIGAKYGLTNAGQLVVKHEDGDDFGDGGGEGSVLGIVDRKTALGGDVTPTPVQSLAAYGVQGVDFTLTVGEGNSPVESLQCANPNIIALLPTPNAMSTTKLKTYPMAEVGAYAEKFRETQRKDAGPKVPEFADSFVGGLAGDIIDKVKGFMEKGAENLKAFYDANPGDKDAKTVTVEEGDSEGNTGLVNKNKYSSHDNLGGGDISNGTASDVAAAGADWAKAMWEVRVTCLGIPEISGQHEFNRKVSLSVPNPRGGEGSSQLTGEYYVHDYEHSITASESFKTTLVLRGFPGTE